ncbi:MAG: FAD-dependent oxidoreductase [Balneolales bacterium]
MNRKSFIKSSSAAGVGLSLMPFSVINRDHGLSTDSNTTKRVSQSGTKKKVIVAGAGIAGLCCAYELMKLGHEVVVLEASGRQGGTVLSVHDGLSGGLYADYGAENFTKPGYQKYWGYIEEFNLTALPYYHRENRLTRRDDKWYTNDQIAEMRAASVKEAGGFNERELNFISNNPSSNLSSLYLGPYLEKFTDEYQPFGIGYDHLENIPVSEIYRKEGASQAALNQLGGNSSSALYTLWQTYITEKRGYAGDFDLYRIKGGNQVMTDAFARRLGSRVKLDCQILEIEQGETGVTLTYREFGEEKKMSADFLASCLPIPALRNIPVNPALPEQKHFVFDNVNYVQTTRIVFQARSEFWLEDDLSINLTFNHPSLRTIWQVADEVDTHRVALMAKAPGGTNPMRTLETFKELYPGRRSNISIEQTLAKDWSTDRFAPGCERSGFSSLGSLSQYWPHIITPVGRIHFAGGYADNRSWGMEAATNSANRVAQEIDQA